MKQKLYIIIGLCITAGCLLSACDKTATDNDRLPVPDGEDMALQIRAQKAAFMEEDGITRAMTDDVTLQTTFEEGDAIGVFAIKDGVVQPDCKNLKLTLQADRTWKGEGETKVYLISGATYFAYSPYRAEFDNATSFDYIYDNFTVATDQRTAELFAANDLMTCDNCQPNKEEKSLTFTFTHRLALVELGPIYCKGKGNLYPLNSTTPIGITDLNNSSNLIIGYSFQTNAQQLPKMHLLMKPSTYSGGFIFSYKKTSSNAILMNTSSTTLTANTLHKLKLYQKRDVVVGDYYYSNGSVFPKEWITTGTPPPDIDNGCIGVVFTTPDASSANGNHFNMLASEQNSGYKNGTVLAIWGKRYYHHMGLHACFGSSGYIIFPFAVDAFDLVHFDKVSKYQNKGELHGNTYSGHLGLAQANSNNVEYNGSYDFTGYDPTSYTIYKYPTYKLVNDYEVDKPSPPHTSGWYPPSAKQMAIVGRNLGGVTGGLFNTTNDNSWYTGSEGDTKFAKAINLYFAKVNPADKTNKAFITCTYIEDRKCLFLFVSSATVGTTSGDRYYFGFDTKMNSYENGLYPMLSF